MKDGLIILLLKQHVLLMSLSLKTCKCTKWEKGEITSQCTAAKVCFCFCFSGYRHMMGKLTYMIYRLQQMNIGFSQSGICSCGDVQNLIST